MFFRKNDKRVWNLHRLYKNAWQKVVGIGIFFELKKKANCDTLLVRGGMSSNSRLPESQIGSLIWK